jgi:hypothetical protein
VSKPVAVHERSIWIVDYLRRAAETPERTIRHLWEEASKPRNEDGTGGLGDTATLPTYHRTVAKLVRQGQVEEAGVAADGAALYRAVAQLSPFSTYTLADLNAALWELSAVEAMSQYLDAVDYYEKQAQGVLREAAQRLLKEDPRELVLRMLRDRSAELEEDLGILEDPSADDRAHRAQTRRRLEDLRYFVNSELGINAKVWGFPAFEQIEKGVAKYAAPDWALVGAALAEHVFGAAFVELARVPDVQPRETALLVAGSDGSSHTGYVRGVPAPQYVEEEGRMLLTFNNSVAYIDLPAGHPHKIPFPYHGVPMTRAAIEDPGNRGMIVSRPWFEDLTDSQFEHMKKAALDVVQFRVDERLLAGIARAFGSSPAGGEGGLLPKPNVLIRDGTVTPQEREFQHYCHRSSYGDVVREGIGLSYTILRSVRDSESRLYGGAVKQTQLKTFSKVLNWFIKRTIDDSWDLSKASHVTDSVAITRLIAALPECAANEYYRTCVVVRPFHALVTDLRSLRCESDGEWLEYFTRRRDQQQREYDQHGGEASWLLGQTLEDDPYVRMCQQADYAAFYFGKPGGEPEVTLPRFEFLDSLRKRRPEERAPRVERAVDLIITGVHVTKWTLDREHNFMTARRMPRLVPYVVYEAHEKCKALGHKLEAELMQAITHRLSELKALRGLPVPRVEIEPVPLEQFRARLKRLEVPPSEE